MDKITPKEFALANIALVEIEVINGETFALKEVASEAEVTAYISEGQNEILRVKNTIKAQNNTEDIALGYDIRLASATFIPEILEVVDGGVWNSVNQMYSAPEIGLVIERQKFHTNIYTEIKDGDGETKGYVKFTYENCKGKPVNYSLVDGNFYAPEFNISSRGKIGESPVTVTFVDSLPGEDLKETNSTASYTPSSSVTNIIPNKVLYDSESEKFVVPAGIRVFTFEDGATDKVAVYIDNDWEIKNID